MLIRASPSYVENGPCCAVSWRRLRVTGVFPTPTGRKAGPSNASAAMSGKAPKWPAASPCPCDSRHRARGLGPFSRASCITATRRGRAAAGLRSTRGRRARRHSTKNTASPCPSQAWNGRKAALSMALPCMRCPPLCRSGTCPINGGRWDSARSTPARNWPCCRAPARPMGSAAWSRPINRAFYRTTTPI